MPTQNMSATLRSRLWPLHHLRCPMSVKDIYAKQVPGHDLTLIYASLRPRGPHETRSIQQHRDDKSGTHPVLVGMITWELTSFWVTSAPLAASVSFHLSSLSQNSRHHQSSILSPLLVASPHHRHHAAWPTRFGIVSLVFDTISRRFFALQGHPR